MSFSKILTRIGVVLALAIGGLTVTSTAANATPWDPQVHVSGHVDCGGLDEAVWMWYRADNGEQGWADLSNWTTVSRWTGIAGRWTRFIQVRTYNLTLYNVSTRGTTLHLTMGCRGAISGVVKQYSTSFGVNRPAFGRGVTRHVCDNPPLGCWV